MSENDGQYSQPERIGLIVTSLIAIASLVFAIRANSIAKQANLAAKHANTLAQTANELAQAANALAQQGNTLARESNTIALLEIAEADVTTLRPETGLGVLGYPCQQPDDDQDYYFHIGETIMLLANRNVRDIALENVQVYDSRGREWLVSLAEEGQQIQLPATIKTDSTVKWSFVIKRLQNINDNLDSVNKDLSEASSSMLPTTNWTLTFSDGSKIEWETSYTPFAGMSSNTDCSYFRDLPTLFAYEEE